MTFLKAAGCETGNSTPSRPRDSLPAILLLAKLSVPRDGLVGNTSPRQYLQFLECAWQGSGQPGTHAKSILLEDLALPTGSPKGCKEEVPVHHHCPKHLLYLPQPCSKPLPGAHGSRFAAGTVLLGKEAVHTKG